MNDYCLPVDSWLMFIIIRDKLSKSETLTVGPKGYRGSCSKEKNRTIQTNSKSFREGYNVIFFVLDRYCTFWYCLSI